MNVREKYLRTCGDFQARPLVAVSGGAIGQAVVIPALAERDSLFRTLAAIAGNPESELHRTLVICVVNNHRPSLAGEAEIRNNRETLAILDSLVSGRPLRHDLSAAIERDIEVIARSGLRLAFIDASSSGMEIPERDGGVGAAMRI